MKIRVDSNGNILVVARDSETVSDSISITDNEDLIQNPAKYQYINGTLVKRNYVSLSTNKTDTNGNGIPDCSTGLNHTITATFYNNDDTIDTSVNGTFSLIFSNQSGQSKTYSITVTNGVGSIDLASDWSGIYSVIINDSTRYCEVLFIEFV